MKLAIMAIAFCIPLTALAAKSTPQGGGGSSGALFKCTDSAGNLLYTNQRESGHDCKALERNYPITTFSVPNKGSGTAARPADFPKVGGEQQKSRDTDRKAILQQELANEEKMLEQAKKIMAEQQGVINPDERVVNGGVNQGKVQERMRTYEDTVQLHQRNIDALQKELSR